MSQTDYRNRHDREEQHFGELPATLVGLSSALGVYVAGTTVEELVAIIHERLVRLEGAQVAVSSITANAVIAARHVVADAVIRKTITGSLTADAETLAVGGAVTHTGSLTADAITQREQLASVNADAVIEREQAGSLAADAVITTTVTYTFALAADAVLKKEMTGSLTADAYITDGTEEEASSTLGEFTLGDSTLGG